MANGKLPVDRHAAGRRRRSRRPARSTFVDNAVDMTTDTIKLKATFDEHRSPPVARPVRARDPAARRRCQHAIVVPAQAVQTGQDGQYVFVVKPDSTVEQRPVTPGQRVDDDRRDRQGTEAGRDGRHRRTAAARAGSRVTTDRRWRGAGQAAAAAAAGAAAGRAAAQVQASGEARRSRPGIAGPLRGPVNVSEVFIRRPIATSLLMAAHRAVRHHRLPRAAGQRSAAGRLPDAQRQRRPAGRRSRHDGVVGREPARAAVHDHRRPRLDDLAQRLGQHQHHAAVRSRARHRQRHGRRADGDRRGHAAAPRRHDVAAVVPQEQSRPTSRS